MKYVTNPQHIKGINVVNEIDKAVKELEKGHTIARFEYGNSMFPILHSGEYCIVKPITDINKVKVGDTVLCKVNGYLMTHMVIMKSNTSIKPYFLIGSTHLDIYGWTDEIFGIAFGTKIIENPRDFDEAEEIK